MKRTIYIFSNGELKRKSNTIFFEKEDGARKYIPIENTGEIMVFGEVSVNKKMLEFLSQQEVILHFYNHYGYYAGSFYPRQHYNSGYMILKQADHYLKDNKRFELARQFVSGGIRNVQRVLDYYNSRNVDLSECLNNILALKEKVDTASSVEELMAYEGNCRDYYYQSFDRIIQAKDFSFSTRSKRPPENELNALISFGNSLIYTIVLSEIYKTHLDPRIGFLHSTNFRRFTLNLDVAEIFKPILVDRIIFSLINKGMIKKKHFEQKFQGMYLKEKGRQTFIEELDKRLKTTIRHPKLRKQVSYRRLIRLELYKLEKHFIGEEAYEPFVAKW
jgi:CRISPR-associated protein Cas1